MYHNIIMYCVIILALLSRSMALNEFDPVSPDRIAVKRLDKAKILKEEAEGKKEFLAESPSQSNLVSKKIEPLEEPRQPEPPQKKVESRIESEKDQRRVSEKTERKESEKGSENSESESGNEIKSSKEITNEDVVRRRKQEKKQFGEAQYVDYPGEEIEGKEGENKAKAERRKTIKTAKRTLELLDGIAEVGQGIVLFAKVGAEG